MLNAGGEKEAPKRDRDVVGRSGRFKERSLDRRAAALLADTEESLSGDNPFSIDTPMEMGRSGRIRERTRGDRPTKGEPSAERGRQGREALSARKSHEEPRRPGKAGPSRNPPLVQEATADPLSFARNMHAGTRSMINRGSNRLL